MTKFLLAFSMFITSAANAEPVTFTCPEKLFASSTTESTEPSWEAFGMQNQVHRNIGAFISAGPPKDLAQLKPWNADTSSSYRAKHRNEGDIYKFEGESPNGYWLQCMYNNTTAGFSRRLPDGLKVCQIKTAKGPMVCK